MQNSSTFPDSSTLLQDRYRSDATEPTEPWDETISLLLSHRSVRSYLPKALPPGTIETLVASAQSASTSSNLQTWSVVAVEDPKRKARLAELACSQKHIVEAPLFLVWVADLSLLEMIGERDKVSTDGLNYLEYLIVAVVDATLAAQNAFVALESLGLGGVYIGAIRNNTELVAAELGLPSKAFPVFGLTVGFPDPSIVTEIKPRLPQAAILHREQYSCSAIPAAVAEYDQRMRKFQAEQKLEVTDWSRQAASRIGLLMGRDHLAQDLHKLGFALR
jgi:nitroreductase